MFCPECGYRNPDKAKFCMSCGYKYEHSSEQSFFTQPQRSGRVLRLSLYATVVLLAVVSIIASLLYWKSNKPESTPLVGQNVNQNISSLPSPTSSPSPSPSPSPTVTQPVSVEVRLQLLSQGAMRYAPLEGTGVILVTNGQTFRAATDGRGLAVFRGVPCGDFASITAPDFELKNGGVWRLRRRLQCTTSIISLGSFGDVSGRQLSKEDRQYILR